MRNMSFAMTETQVREQTKDVTRRLGWLFLKPGDLVQPVRKAMGLRKGEQIEKIGPPIRIVSTRRELLSSMLSPDYGWEEMVREGFAMHPELDHPKAWVQWFAKGHGCTLTDLVSRIEFEYTEAP